MYIYPIGAAAIQRSCLQKVTGMKSRPISPEPKMGRAFLFVANSP